MPGTRRRISATVAAEQEPSNPQSDSLLRFNEPLSWRAGKAIPVAELLSRLQKLAKELRSLDPEGEVDPKSVVKIAQDLASPNLLAHKDRGIRAWTACCVVDLLRICVPHAPFRSPQLKVCACGRRREKCALLRYLGHIHHYRELHHTSACGSLECLQCATYLCAHVIGGSAQYRADHRSRSA